MDVRAKRNATVKYRRSGQRAIRSRLEISSVSSKPGSTRIRCSSRMARLLLPRTGACRSTSRVRITTSSHAGQIYNSLGYAGVSSDVLGTLTFLRQNALTLDGVFAYDPMAASYAFSALGFSSSNCGAGDTETCRITTAIKYQVAIGAFRIGALAQVGGYGREQWFERRLRGTDRRRYSDRQFRLGRRLAVARCHLQVGKGRSEPLAFRRFELPPGCRSRHFCRRR